VAATNLSTAKAAAMTAITNSSDAYDTYAASRDILNNMILTAPASAVSKISAASTDFSAQCSAILAQTA
jgi:hypothetical protein